MVSLGPKVPNITARNPKTLRPSLPRAPKRQPTVSKIHASGRLRGAITETLAKPLHNDTPCVLGRHASRRPPHTGKSSQACFVRTDHTASSQGHPSHTPQRIHPISYAKAISLQHISSSHSSTIPPRIRCHARYLRTHSLHGASVEPPCLFTPNRNGHNHMSF